jgi:GNAT superfamily N-acetyltransferase
MGGSYAAGMSRRHMVIDLRSASGPLDATPPGVRHPTEGDVEALAALMLDAYRGTVDADGSETMEDARTEVRGYFDANSGAPMLEHSYVVPDGGRLVSAVLVSRFEEMPLLAYAMTAPSHKGRGLASALTHCALESLRAAGDTQMHLWVTAGNADAEHLYERFGFRDIEPGPMGREIRSSDR